MAEPSEAQVILYRRGTAGTITYRENSSSYFIDYNVEWYENKPIKVTVWLDNANTISTVNLMNSSCAQWSDAVTGALALGDYLQFGFYQSDGMTVDVLFYGIITELSPGVDNTLVVTAMNYLYHMDVATRVTQVYENFKDYTAFDSTKANDLRVITGVTDADILTPMSYVGFGANQFRKYMWNTNINPLSSGNDYLYDIEPSADYYYAQKFTAEALGLLGVASIWVRTDVMDLTDTPKIIVEIWTDNDGTHVGGIQIATKTVDVTLVVPGPSEDEVHADFTSSSQPLFLIPGAMYWVVIKRGWDPVNGTASIKIGSGNGYASRPISNFYYDIGGGRTEEADSNLHLNFDYIDYELIGEDDYWFDDNNNRVELYSGIEELTSLTSPSYTVYRGCLRYFYGLRSIENIMTKFIEADGIMDASVNANCDRQYGYASVRGKPVGDACREVLDVFESVGAPWAGYQHVMAHYNNAGVQTCKVGKRKKIGDASTSTFSHGDDSATDSEKVIIGDVDIKKTVGRKYSTVHVVGESFDGEPIQTTLTDRADTTSLYTKTSGFVGVYIHTDTGIRSLTEARIVAEMLLKTINTDLWEGSIKLSGHHRLWDWSTSSDTFGSGQIITLNWSPLGISAVQFKVKSCTISRFSTEIYVTNEDTLNTRKLNFISRRGEKNEVFQFTPAGDIDTVYLNTYKDATDPGASMYMALYDSGDTLLDEHIKVLADRTVLNNLVTYRAVFAPENGFGAVHYVKLLNSGGAVQTTQNLYDTSGSVVLDERVLKMKGQQMIVEFQCKDT